MKFTLQMEMCGESIDTKIPGGVFHRGRLIIVEKWAENQSALRELRRTACGFEAVLKSSEW
jgi:hypothetical protein